MDLTNLLNQNPRLSVADDQDQPDLFSLFRDHPMKSAGITLEYDRQPNFFSLLKAQGEGLTLMLKSADAATACASITQSARFVNGEKRLVFYLSDLRVKADRRTSLEWRRLYSEVVEKLQKQNGAVLLTAVLKDNVAAIQALNKNANTFHYQFLKQVSMVNVFAQLYPKRFDFKVRNVQLSERRRLLEFLEKAAKLKQFGYSFPDELERRESTWPGFSFTDFLVAEQNGTWMGVCLPWSPSPIKRMMLRSAPKLQQLAFSSLSLLNRKAPRVGEALETVYLTHLYFISNAKDSDVTAGFLQKLSTEGIFKKAHMLSFVGQDEAVLQSAALKPFVKQVTAVNLYSVTGHNRESLINVDTPFDFEMCLV